MLIILQYIYATRNALFGGILSIVAQTNVCATASQRLPVTVILRNHTSLSVFWLLLLPLAYPLPPIGRTSYFAGLR
jgi:hypothetical protein